MTRNTVRIDESHRLALGESSAGHVDTGVDSLCAAKLLLIGGGEHSVRRIRACLFDAGYRGVSTVESSSAGAVAALYRELPDLVLLELSDSRGLGILEVVREDQRFARLPILILVGSTDRRLRSEALSAGATDFIRRPVESDELTTRVRNALVARQNEIKLTSVQQNSTQLRDSRWEFIHCLARATQLRDQHTGAHGLRVGGYAGLIARQMGLPNEYARLIEEAASLHDIGKLAVSDSILKKSGRLSPDEFEEMQLHSMIGKQICDPTTTRESCEDEDVGYVSSRPRMSIGRSSEFLKMAGRIALTHHEWWDGTGYPDGLSGNEIPLEGRITTAADVFDALSSRRPYKPALPPEKCFEILEDGKGTQFDPGVIDAFSVVKHRVENIAAANRDIVEHRICQTSP